LTELTSLMIAVASSKGMHWIWASSWVTLRHQY
jgi:hypothetical protein